MTIKDFLARYGISESKFFYVFQKEFKNNTRRDLNYVLSENQISKLKNALRITKEKPASNDPQAVEDGEPQSAEDLKLSDKNALLKEVVLRHVERTFNRPKFKLLVNNIIKENIRQWAECKKKFQLTLAQLMASGRSSRRKGLVGVNKGWWRTPLVGCHYYLWWAGRGALPLKEANLPEDTIYIRAIRLHDANSQKLDVGDLKDTFTISQEDLLDSESEIVEDFLSVEQRLFLNSRKPLKVLAGLPGSGKTTTLWKQATESNFKKILYITWSAELSADAEEHFQSHAPIGTDILTMPFSMFLGKILGYDVERLSNAKSFGLFLKVIEGLDQSLLTRWKGQTKSLYAEIRGAILGGAIPGQKSTVVKDGYVRISTASYLEQYQDDPAAAQVMRLVELLERKSKPSQKNTSGHQTKSAISDMQRIFSDLFCTFEAYQSIISGFIHNEFEDVDCVIVDEIQDLTVIESMVLIEFCLLLIRKNKLQAITFAGDEGQTVRPSGFDWGDFNTLLSSKIQHPYKDVLRGSLRHPKEIQKIIRTASEQYRYIAKSDRPKDQNDHFDRRVSEDVYPEEAHLFYITLDGDTANQFLERIDNYDMLKMIMVSDEYPDWIHAKNKKLVLTPIEAKGLEYQVVCLLGVGQLLEELSSSKNHNSALYRVHYLRMKIDSLRVALSRSNETLIFLDVNPSGSQSFLSMNLLGVQQETSLEELEQFLNDEDEQSTLSKIDARMEEAKARLEENPERAFDCVKLAYQLLVNIGSSEEVFDDSVYEEVCLTLLKTVAYFYIEGFSEAVSKNELQNLSARVFAEQKQLKEFKTVFNDFTEWLAKPTLAPFQVICGFLSFRISHSYFRPIFDRKIIHLQQQYVDFAKDADYFFYYTDGLEKQLEFIKIQKSELATKASQMRSWMAQALYLAKNIEGLQEMIPYLDKENKLYQAHVLFLEQNWNEAKNAYELILRSLREKNSKESDLEREILENLAESVFAQEEWEQTNKYLDAILKLKHSPSHQSKQDHLASHFKLLYMKVTSLSRLQMSSAAISFYETQPQRDFLISDHYARYALCLLKEIGDLYSQTKKHWKKAKECYETVLKKDTKKELLDHGFWYGVLDRLSQILFQETEWHRLVTCLEELVEVNKLSTHEKPLEVSHIYHMLMALKQLNRTEAAIFFYQQHGSDIDIDQTKEIGFLLYKEVADLYFATPAFFFKAQGLYEKSLSLMGQTTKANAQEKCLILQKLCEISHKNNNQVLLEMFVHRLSEIAKVFKFCQKYLQQAIPFLDHQSLYQIQALMVQGDLVQAEIVCKDHLEKMRLPNSSDVVRKASVLGLLGEVYFIKEDWVQANQVFESLLAVLSENKIDQFLNLNHVRMIVSTYKKLDQQNKVLSFYETYMEGIDYDAYTDDLGVMDVIKEIGDIYYEKKDTWENAQFLYEKIWRTFENIDRTAMASQEFLLKKHDIADRLGVIAFRKENWNQTVSYLEEALKLSRVPEKKIPLFLSHISMMIVALRHLNQKKEAVLFCDEWVSIVQKDYYIKMPNAFDALKEMGDLYFSTNRLWSKAQGCYDKAWQLSSSGKGFVAKVKVDLLNNLVIATFNQGDKNTWKLTERYFKLMVKLIKQENLKGYLSLRHIYQILTTFRRLEKAKEIFQFYEMWIEDLQEGSYIGNSTAFSIFKEIGELYLDVKEWQKAKGCFDCAIKSIREATTDNIAQINEVLNHLSQVSFTLEDWPQVQVYVEEKIQLRRDLKVQGLMQLEHFYMLAEAYRKQNKVDLLISQCQSLSEEVSFIGKWDEVDVSAILEVLGDVYENEQKDFEKASECYQRAFEAVLLIDHHSFLAKVKVLEKLFKTKVSLEKFAEAAELFYRLVQDLELFKIEKFITMDHLTTMLEISEKLGDDQRVMLFLEKLLHEDANKHPLSVILNFSIWKAKGDLHSRNHQQDMARESYQSAIQSYDVDKKEVQNVEIILVLEKVLPDLLEDEKVLTYRHMLKTLCEEEYGVGHEKTLRNDFALLELYCRLEKRADAVSIGKGKLGLIQENKALNDDFIAAFYEVCAKCSKGYDEHLYVESLQLLLGVRTQKMGFYDVRLVDLYFELYHLYEMKEQVLEQFSMGLTLLVVLLKNATAYEHKIESIGEFLYQTSMQGDRLSVTTRFFEDFMSHLLQYSQESGDSVIVWYMRSEEFLLRYGLENRRHAILEAMLHVIHCYGGTSHIQYVFFQSKWILKGVQDLTLTEVEYEWSKILNLVKNNQGHYSVSLGALHHMIGQMYFQLHNVDEAERFFSSSSILSQEVEDYVSWALALQGLLKLYQSQNFEVKVQPVLMKIKFLLEQKGVSQKLSMEQLRELSELV